MSAVTNAQILSAIGEVKADVSGVKTDVGNLKETQAAQGQQIMAILLARAEEQGEANGATKLRERRSSSKLLLWTLLGSAGTLLAAIVAIGAFVLDVLHRVQGVAIK